VRGEPTFDRAWFEREATVVAPALLNKVLVIDVDGSRCSGRIVEVEAYMPDDPASHSFNGPTKRNAVMFGPAGHLYVYLCYGIHKCVNIVTGPAGSGQAVLIRALDPIEGIDTMRRRRKGAPDGRLTDGPGKLAQALGLDLGHNTADLLDATSSVRIVGDGVRRPASPIVGPRVGISRATTQPWRFRVPVSRK
jgi:DNA-3-methyladenine glycosylase